MAGFWVLIGGGVLSSVASFVFLMAGLAHNKADHEHLVAPLFTFATILQGVAIGLLAFGGAAQ